MESMINLLMVGKNLKFNGKSRRERMWRLVLPMLHPVELDHTHEGKAYWKIRQDALDQADATVLSGSMRYVMRLYLAMLQLINGERAYFGRESL